MQLNVNLTKWEPADYLCLIAILSVVGLIASGFNGPLKGALATLILYMARRTTRQNKKEEDPKDESSSVTKKIKDVLDP